MCLFAGKSGMGPRGDAIVELDGSVGEVLRCLDENGLAGNTLVVFTSDNGPVVDDGYRDEAVEKLGDHRPAGPIAAASIANSRAAPASLSSSAGQGGSSPGPRSALQSGRPARELRGPCRQGGLEASVPDSRNHLACALLGDDPVGGESLIEHAGGLSLRRGRWKFIPASNGPKKQGPTNTELGNDPSPQLYDLDADPGETVQRGRASPRDPRTA